MSPSGQAAAGSSSLAGVSVVVTRATHQAAPLRDGLIAAGAAVVSAPAIEIVDPSDGGVGLQAAITALSDGAYDWVVATSANGAERLVEALTAERNDRGEGSAAALGLDAIRVASVGPATTRALEAGGLSVALEAHEAIGDSLVDRFGAEESTKPGSADVGDGRVLVVRAETGRPTVPDGLAALGWNVDLVAAYAVAPVAFNEPTLDAIAAADVITFASGRTAAFIVEACGADRLPATVVCIGPVAAKAATELGLVVAEVADPHTTEGLIEAVIASQQGR